MKSHFKEGDMIYQIMIFISHHQKLFMGIILLIIVGICAYWGHQSFDKNEETKPWEDL